MKRDIAADIERVQGAIHGTCLALINLQDLYYPDYQDETKALYVALRTLKKKRAELCAIRDEGLPRE